MWYADVRGHHGKRWNYPEPKCDWYMGRHEEKKMITQNHRVHFGSFILCYLWFVLCTLVLLGIFICAVIDWLMDLWKKK